jgi:Ca2+-transporting ATPase
MRSALGLNNIQGLSEGEALRRLREVGYNELPASKPRSFLSIAFEVVRQPMFLLLMTGGGLYLFLGDVREAIMLFGFVFFVMAITLYEERKTERALEALRDLSSPRALVIRGGAQKRIAGREVVPDDIIVISEGDRVPADAVLLACNNLTVDESLLTGESVPVRKMCAVGEVQMARPGGEDLPFVYSGTLAVRGLGIARVKATGMNTEIGRIGKALKAIQPEDTPLQKETSRLVRKIALMGMSLCVVLVIAYGLTRDSWVNGFLAGITLAMAMLPEEFPVVLTIFLALGAWRISKKRVLTRRVPAVETLGSASVLCVDKTGTLTQNRMSVRELRSKGKSYRLNNEKTLPEEFHEVVEYGMLASQIDPFDPMEKAVNELGKLALDNTEHIHYNWTLVQEYPLSPELLAMSRTWKSPVSEEYVIAAKGAPESIADICHLRKDEMEAVSSDVDTMARAGLRVIGIARATFSGPVLPRNQHEFEFRFIGLIGLSDPVRPGIPKAIKECYAAQIRVIMITGDYPLTAQNIGREIGLQNPLEVITGPELDGVSDQELKERIKSVNIFARVVPEQKLRIVNALKSNRLVVAMTGDGVNDAAALKASDIGIAMGGRGTDVARESADMVLLDDDFSSIVQAVKMGRRIFDNLKKAMSYILAIHIPIAGVSLLPVLFGWPMVLLPVHIVFLELIIDPACSIVFEGEPEEADIMKRPPRRLEEPLFSKRAVIFSVLQGLGVLLVVLLVFGIAWYLRQGDVDARALSFTTLIIANLGLILTNRSWSRTILDTLRTRNAALWWVLGGALFFLGLVLYLPFLRGLFHFSKLHLDDILIAFLSGAFSIFWFELFKMARRRQRSKEFLS